MYVCSEELYVEWVIKNEVDLVVESLYDMIDEDFFVRVIGFDGENVFCYVNKGFDNWYYVRFIFYKVGLYKVRCFFVGCWRFGWYC